MVYTQNPERAYQWVLTQVIDTARGVDVPPQPGITVTPTAGLVTIDVSTSDDSEGLVSSGTQGPATSSIQLSFDGANWDQPQTVSVHGVDDAVVDGDIAYAIVTAPAISTDPDYNGRNADDVSVTNLDDETPVGVGVAGIAPNSLPRNTTAPVTITGSGFQQGATVTFENGGGRVPTATNIIVVNATTIDATVSVHRKAKLLVWDVRVTNPDGSSGVLVDGFTVTP